MQIYEGRDQIRSAATAYLNLTGALKLLTEKKQETVTAEAEPQQQSEPEKKSEAQIEKEARAKAEEIKTAQEAEQEPFATPEETAEPQRELAAPDEEPPEEEEDNLVEEQQQEETTAEEPRDLTPEELAQEMIADIRHLFHNRDDLRRVEQLQFLYLNQKIELDVETRRAIKQEHAQLIQRVRDSGERFRLNGPWPEEVNQ